MVIKMFRCLREELLNVDIKGGLRVLFVCVFKGEINVI